MQVIKTDIPATGTDCIRILPLADFHVGDKQVDMKLVRNLIERVRTEPDLFCVLGGDLMNTALATSVSDSYNETITPMDQIKRCVELFGPISDKILGIVGGNHEARAWKQAGLDTTALFAAQLGLEDKYSDTTALLFCAQDQTARTTATARLHTRST